VFEGPVAEAGGVHTAEGSWSPAEKVRARRVLPVYERQLFPEKLLGEPPARLADGRHHDVPNQGAAHLDAGRRGLIASIKNKMHAISPEVMEGLMEAVDRPRRLPGHGDLVGRRAVLVGADLEATMPAFVSAGRTPSRASSRSCRT
jgi:3-hydroxyacyl-CoA dehydrogenase